MQHPGTADHQRLLRGMAARQRRAAGRPSGHHPLEPDIPFPPRLSGCAAGSRPDLRTGRAHMDRSGHLGGHRPGPGPDCRRRRRDSGTPGGPSARGVLPPPGRAIAVFGTGRDASRGHSFHAPAGPHPPAPGRAPGRGRAGGPGVHESPPLFPPLHGGNRPYAGQGGGKTAGRSRRGGTRERTGGGTEGGPGLRLRRSGADAPGPSCGSSAGPPRPCGKSGPEREGDHSIGRPDQTPARAARRAAITLL
jgi:hypothetical protein